MDAATINDRSEMALHGQRNALIIADDIGVFLAIARSLGRIGVVVDIATSIDNQPGFASKYIRDVHYLPSYLQQTQAWLKHIQHLCVAQDYGLIIPTNDSSLALLNCYADNFASGQLALPNACAFEVFSDKKKCRELATELGVIVAGGKILDCDSNPDDLISELNLPMVCKPRRSFHWGDLEDKKWAKIVTDREQLIDIIDHCEPDTMIAESFFCGDGIGVSVLAEEGSVKIAWQHRRLQTVSDTGKSSSRKGEPVNPQLYRDVERLAEAVSLNGVAMFEFRYNQRAKTHILIEVNPRFWGSLPLAVAAGADFPAALWHQHYGEPHKMVKVDFDTIRYDLTGELTRINHDFDRENSLLVKCSAMSNLVGLLFSLFRPQRIDSWAIDDASPFARERKAIFSQIFQKFSRHFQS